MLIKMTGASPSQPGKYRFGEDFKEEVGEEEEEEVEPPRTREPTMEIDDIDPGGFDLEFSDEDNQTLAVIRYNKVNKVK